MWFCIVILLVGNWRYMSVIIEGPWRMCDLVVLHDVCRKRSGVRQKWVAMKDGNGPSMPCWYKSYLHADIMTQVNITTAQTGLATCACAWCMGTFRLSFWLCSNQRIWTTISNVNKVSRPWCPLLTFPSTWFHINFKGALWSCFEWGFWWNNLFLNVFENMAINFVKILWVCRFDDLMI